jgi:Short C-terminal domain
MRGRGIGRRGRPGLVGTMARTAVVAGTATAVVGGVSRHQQANAQQAADAQAFQAQQDQAAQQAAIDAAVAQQMASQQMAPPPAPAAAAGGSSVIDQLKELAALKDAGILTQAEFDAQKTKLLGS